MNPLDTWAMDLDYRRKEEGLDAVRAALKDLLPGVLLTRIDREQRELIFATPDGELPLDQLSEGYQNMAAWCGDLLYRITEVYKDYKAPLSARGLLLIDEIDLHLHPVWQRVLREFLNRKLPHFQIFATTHSPLTAQQAGEGELFFLQREARKGGPANLEPYPGAPNKLLLHQLLLSPAFGLTSLDSKKVEDMKGEYRSLKARKSKLPAAEKRRLGELRDELVDLPEWTRPTKEDKRQVELLEEIQQTLRNGPGDSPSPKAPAASDACEPLSPWSTPTMTRLERVRDKALIPAVFRDPKRIDKVLTLLVASGTKPDFDSGYWKKAKKQLKAESGGKCPTARHRPPPSPTATWSTSGPRRPTGGWPIATIIIYMPARSAIRPIRETTSRSPARRSR